MQTAQRNRLQPDHLNACVRAAAVKAQGITALNGFDVKAAFMKWVSKERRNMDK